MIFNFCAIALLIAMSAVLSAMETAVTAATLNKIKLAKLREVKNAEKALKLLPIKEKMISVLLIAENVFNTLATALGTSTAVQMCGQEIGLVVSSIITPILLVTFCEILPKIIGVIKAESILINAHFLFRFLLSVFAPLSNTLDHLTNFVRRRIKPNPLYELHHDENPSSQNTFANSGTKTLAIGNNPVTEIMTTIEALQKINYDLAPEAFVEEALSIPYAKIPVWQHSQKNIIGILQVHLLLKSIHNRKDKTLKGIIASAITPLKTIQQTTQIASQLVHFIKHQYGFAIVVNEDSTHLGFLTLNDITLNIASLSEDAVKL
jgi:Mg2+/Co2+ transporter CorB